MAIVDPTAGSNPVQLTKEGALQIFDMALAGKALARRRALPISATRRPEPLLRRRCRPAGSASGSARRRDARLPDDRDALILIVEPQLELPRQDGRMREAQPRAERAQVADRAIDLGPAADDRGSPVAWRQFLAHCGIRAWKSSNCDIQLPSRSVISWLNFAGVLRDFSSPARRCRGRRSPG